VQAGDPLVELLEAADAVPALPADRRITARRKDLRDEKILILKHPDLQLWRTAYLGERKVLVDGRPNAQTHALRGLQADAGFNICLIIQQF